MTLLQTNPLRKISLGKLNADVDSEEDSSDSSLEPDGDEDN